jgi:hypothetical protein
LTVARRGARGGRLLVGAVTLGCAVLVGVGVTSSAVAQTGPGTDTGPAPGGPQAAAWALRVTESGGVQQTGLAQVAVESAPTPGAWGAPVELDGQQPVAAAASMAAPDVTKNEVNWQDPTGSITIDGGFAQASVTPTSASARAGIGTGSGSSFSVANKYLSWDQQQELTGEVANLNAALIPKLNTLLGTLSPALALLGLSVPPFQQMSGLALIDVADGEGVTASATTASSPSYASAKAQAGFGTLALLGGFITLTGIESSADSESNAGVPTQSASATLGQVQIAGITVTADQHGLEVAGNDVADRQLLQPVVDLLLSELTSSGVSLHFDETTLADGLQEATALELDVSSAAGLMQLSVGHAEAAAGSTSAPAPPPISGTSGAPESLPLSAVGPTAPVVEAASPVASVAPAPMSSAPSGSRGSGGGIPAWLGVSPPAAVARALHGVFLWLLFGALAVAALPPLLIGYLRRRAASSIVPLGEETSP